MIESINLKISEPWDFTSSDGDNLLNCYAIKEIQVESHKILLCKCTSCFKIENNEVEHIGLLKRGETDNQYNIYKIVNADNFDDSALLKPENFIHIMIGTKIN